MKHKRGELEEDEDEEEEGEDDEEEETDDEEEEFEEDSDLALSEEEAEELANERLQAIFESELNIAQRFDLDCFDQSIDGCELVCNHGSRVHVLRHVLNIRLHLQRGKTIFLVPRGLKKSM